MPGGPGAGHDVFDTPAAVRPTHEACRTNLRRLGDGAHPVTNGLESIGQVHRATLHGCTVKDRCLIGIGSIVMDGAVVGPDSMVAAGALVPPGMVVPPGTLAVGSPARVKRPLTPEEIARLPGQAESYAARAERYREEGWPAR